MVAAPPKGKAPNVSNIADATAFYEPVVTSPGMFSRLGNATTTALDKIGSIPMYTIGIGAASTAIGWVGLGIGKVVHKGTGDKVYSATQTVQSGVGRVLGATPRDLGNLTGTRRFAGETANRVTGFVAPMLKTLVEGTGIADWQVKKHGKEVARRLPGAIKEAQAFGEKELGILKKASKTNPSARHLKVMHRGLLEAEKTGKLPAYVAHAGKAIKREVAIGNFIPEGTETFYNAVEKVAHHDGRVQRFSNIEKAVKDAPKSWSKMAIGHNAVNAAGVGLNAIAMFGVAHGLAGHISALKHMYADMTGTDAKKVSLIKVMTSGSVPPPVAEARSQMIKQFGLQGTMQAVGLFIGIKQLRGGQISGKAIAGQMALAFGGAQIAGMLGESPLPVYEAFRTAHLSGKRIPLDYYTAFIGTASPLLRSKGGAENPFTQAVAQQYYEEKAGPKEIMDDIASGTLVKRIEKIAADNDAARTQPAQAAAPETPVQDKPVEEKTIPADIANGAAVGSTATERVEKNTADADTAKTPPPQDALQEALQATPHQDKLNGKTEPLKVLGKHTSDVQQQRSETHHGVAV